jgi:hypothetical protein
MHSASSEKKMEKTVIKAADYKRSKIAVHMWVPLRTMHSYWETVTLYWRHGT